MPKKKAAGKKAEERKGDELVEAGIYKDYDIEWLRKEGEEHPDYHLVAEYDEKYGKPEEAEEEVEEAEEEVEEEKEE